ncbi:hypothetical protein [Salibacterium lacus]|uniref:Uncharacterized protein n=1 Tax=Salibacterium lacus TaxID=1898109 RepID=A0ABW5T3B2_9BACI
MNDDSKVQQLEEEIEAFKQESRDFYTALEKRFKGTGSENDALVHFFSYSVYLSTDDVILLGSFTIKNTGNTVQNVPGICLVFHLPKNFSFTGKFVRSEESVVENNEAVWRMMPEKKGQKEEIWLEPREPLELVPGSSISFESFQLVWEWNDAHDALVYGYTYQKETEESSASLNHIHIQREQTAKKKKGASSHDPA